MLNYVKIEIMNYYLPLVIMHQNAAKLSQDPERDYFKLSACQKHEFQIECSGSSCP